MGVRFEEGSPERLFHELDRKHCIVADQLLAHLGLDGSGLPRGVGKIGQPMILTILSQQKNGTIESQKELARRLRVSPATVTISLKSMERDGYVKKLSNADDLRCKPIAITEKGRKATQIIDEVFETLDHGMYKGFSEQELKQIASLYQRMIENLDAMAAGTQES